VIIPGKCQYLEDLYVYRGTFPGSKIAQPEPYISHLNESALQVLNLGGAANSDELRGDIFPLKNS